MPAVFTTALATKIIMDKSFSAWFASGQASPAGGRTRDGLVAGLGGLIGIGLTALVCHLAGDLRPVFLYLVAPMGASAVLVFAVPASPLAQPWSVFGGNVVSALVGVAAAKLIGQPVIAAGVAVGGAIVAMSVLRCLHPPGGAAALTAVIGGPATTALGFLFPFVPVAVDAAVLLAAGWLFHRFSGHAYPHHPRLAATAVVIPGLRRTDIDRALKDLGETLDVSREDLDALLQRAEHYASAEDVGQ